ncbi:MAG: histidine--tRNA ligase [Chloroflexota bacterium]|nr:histidine--tRNA ligase [Chloroflexota bacterium]
MFQAPRGTTDLLPEEQKYWRYIQSKAVQLITTYGFGRIDSPVFEDSGLFVRSVGEGTDIVEKEMYTFDDRGGDSITLRPEGTAPVCRAYLEHGMHNLPQPVRMYYFCPVFRYERPQAGRFRQHHQFGLEILGDSDASVDAEVIEIAWRLMMSLGLIDINLMINSVGDKECRPKYVESLRSYYLEYKDILCPDCTNRMDRNPLRLLDCKVKTCRDLGESAPRSSDNLCEDCQMHWDKLIAFLNINEIPFNIDHRLVRGLDYYTRTVFEIQPQDVGGQSTICGGGRYDGLMEQLGGKPTPGIGFGSGIERLILNLKKSNVEVLDDIKPEYLVINVGENAREVAAHIASRIRMTGVGAILGNGGRALRGQMRQANALGISKAIIIGDDEILRDEIVIRNMEDSSQETKSLEEFLSSLNHN